MSVIVMKAQDTEQQKEINISDVNTLTTEILILKQQTAQNIIEIGKRLITVKESLPHGQWGVWLKEKVDFTDRTAQRFMRVATECSNTTALSGLPRSKVFALLDLPPEEREEFVQSNQVEEMSTRELQQAIKEKKELEEKLKAAEKKTEEEHQAWQNVSDSYKRLEKTNHDHYEQAEKLKKELEVAKASRNADEVERLQKSLKDADHELELSTQKVKELEREIKEKFVEVTTATVEVEKVPKEVEQELNELRKKTKELEIKADQQNNAEIAKFTVYFDTCVKDFGSLLGALAEFRETDPEAHKKYKNAVIGLFGKMSERL